MTFDSAEKIENTELSDEWFSNQSGISAKRPSARADRQRRHADALCGKALDVIFSVKSHIELENGLDEQVWTVKRFDKLPRFRQEYVRGYADGALDAVARLAGVRVTKHPGAVVSRAPKAIRELQPNVSWHQHVYGGGWVADTARVEDSCYVGPQAIVYEYAVVTGQARIYGSARVHEQCEVADRAQIHGQAVICGQSVVTGTARVMGKSIISGDTYLSNDSWSNVELAKTPSSQIAPEEQPASVVERARTMFEQLRPVRPGLQAM